jgi:hypothetical protein
MAMGLLGVACYATTRHSTPPRAGAYGRGADAGAKILASCSGYSTACRSSSCSPPLVREEGQELLRWHLVGGASRASTRRATSRARVAGAFRELPCRDPGLVPDRDPAMPQRSRRQRRDIGRPSPELTEYGGRGGVRGPPAALMARLTQQRVESEHPSTPGAPRRRCSRSTSTTGRRCSGRWRIGARRSSVNCAPCSSRSTSAECGTASSSQAASGRPRPLPSSSRSAKFCATSPGCARLGLRDSPARLRVVHSKAAVPD